MTKSDKRDMWFIALWTALCTVLILAIFPVHKEHEVTLRTTHPPSYHLTVLTTVPLPSTTVPPTVAPTTTTVPVTTTTRPAPPPATSPPIVPAVAPDGVDYHTFYDWPLWRALGRCEEGIGPPPDGILWTKNSNYVSGFGMLRSTFNMDARQIGLPDYYLGYPIAEQIKVARQGHYVRHQYWGCGPRVPGW